VALVVLQTCQAQCNVRVFVHDCAVRLNAEDFLCGSLCKKAIVWKVVGNL
jgi:hypothetical protein